MDRSILFSVYIMVATNSFVAAVAYLACKTVVLGHGCVVIFVLVSVAKCSFGGC